MFELLFDLVYVFSATQVTAFIVHEHSAVGVLQGLLVIGLMWWTWAAYTWLGNQARADQGLLRAGMALATLAVFVVGLAIPETFDDGTGGLYGPLVFVGAYLLVRVIHLGMYVVAAGDDVELRHQVAISWLPLAASAVLLIMGAIVGGAAQTVLFAVALVGEWLSIYLTSRHGAWRIHSVSHWTERYGLFVIIAIGESIVAIGSGASDSALTSGLLVASLLGVTAAICLWWLYFDVVAIVAEEEMSRATTPVAWRSRWRATRMATTYWCPASCLPRRVWSWPSSMRSTGRHSVSSLRSCCSEVSPCTWPATSGSRPVSSTR